MFNKKDESKEQKTQQKAIETKPPQQQEAKSEAKKSNVVSQRIATENAVFKVLKEHKINYVPGNGKAIEHITSEMRKLMIDGICEEFKAKKVEFRDTEANRAKLADDQTLRTYVSGLLGNWLRRSPRLNGTGDKK